MQHVHQILLLGAIGGLIGGAIVLSFMDPNVQQFPSSDRAEFAIWSLLVCLQTGFWAIVFWPLLIAVKELWLRWPEQFIRVGIPLLLVAMRVVVGWQGSDRNAARTNTMSRFETETLTQEDNLKGLALMNPQWVELAMAHTPHRRVILDMDSSESPVHGQQEGAAYNGHFECVCYHPLFLFNQFGDCEGATLRPGNVHSADGWQELLEPVVKGYQKKGLRLLFRGDAAFAKPELYEYLEQGKIGYAIRLPANQYPSWFSNISL